MKRFFLFILILTAFVSCGDSNSEECGDGAKCGEIKLDKSSLTVDGVEYDLTVCSFVKKDNQIVLALNSVVSTNEQKYVSIIMKLINNQSDDISIDYSEFIISSSAIANNISVSENEISVEIEAKEWDESSTKHTFKFNCYQENTINEYPKFYVNEDSQNGNSKVACSALKTNNNKYLISIASITKENNLLGFYGKSNNYPYEMIYNDFGYSGSGQSFYEFSETNNILKVRYSSDETNQNTNVVECEIGKSVIK